jgi:hypothetical protein
MSQDLREVWDAVLRDCLRKANRPLAPASQFVCHNVHIVYRSDIHKRFILTNVSLCDIQISVKRENQLLIRLSDKEKSGFEQAAQIAGINMSAWARQKLRIAALKELRDADRPIPFLNEIGVE